MSWALLLKRSFSVGVLVCPHCGGQCDLLAAIEHKPTVRKILEYLGLESEPPAFAAPRGPPLLAGLEASATADQPRVEGDAERRVVVDRDFVEPEYD
jgi:DNA-binding transcriptional LysR family regulator